MNMRDFQDRVCEWIVKCFPPSLYASKRERALRFLEEAMELAQAEGLTRLDVARMAGYVFNRPVGGTQQEVGGVMVTLAALCWNENIYLDVAAKREIERIEDSAIMEKIRAKQRSKANLPHLTAPLPMNEASAIADQFSDEY